MAEELLNTHTCYYCLESYVINCANNNNFQKIDKYLNILMDNEQFKLLGLSHPAVLIPILHIYFLNNQNIKIMDLCSSNKSLFNFSFSFESFFKLYQAMDDYINNNNSEAILTFIDYQRTQERYCPYFYLKNFIKMACDQNDIELAKNCLFQIARSDEDDATHVISPIIAYYFDNNNYDELEIFADNISYPDLKIYTYEEITKKYLSSNFLTKAINLFNRLEDNEIKDFLVDHLMKDQISKNSFQDAIDLSNSLIMDQDLRKPLERFLQAFEKVYYIQNKPS